MLNSCNRLLIILTLAYNTGPLEIINLCHNKYFSLWFWIYQTNSDTLVVSQCHLSLLMYYFKIDDMHVQIQRCIAGVATKCDCISIKATVLGLIWYKHWYYLTNWTICCGILSFIVNIYTSWIIHEVIPICMLLDVVSGENTLRWWTALIYKKMFDNKLYVVQYGGVGGLWRPIFDTRFGFGHAGIWIYVHVGALLPVKNSSFLDMFPSRRWSESDGENITGRFLSTKQSLPSPYFD